MPVNATRRFVVGAALATAAAARAGSALQPPDADPYAGGSVRLGRGVASTVLDVTDDAFGGAGDGVLLGDLVVSAGSTSITSATAPFVSTERDRGKLVVWRGVDDRVGVGEIASVQSPTRATLAAAAEITARSDGGPNTNGAIGTDNTAAFDAAFDAAQAASARATPDQRPSVPVVQVHVPRGVFLIRTLKTFEQPGVTVRGEGRYSSLIASASEGAWMSLSPFSASPSDAFQGTAFGWTFEDLHFINPCFKSGSSEGNRTGRAIQDNGSGGVRLLSCGFTGLSYGFCGAHGSDFSQIRDSVFYLCDTGYYFGPGSQQLDIDKTDAALCREGAVFEGAPQWHLGGGSSFEDPTIAAITIEAKESGETRLGLPVTVPGAFYSGSFLIDGGTWFETNSGGNGRFAQRMILVDGDGPFGVPVEGVVVRDAYFIAGGEQIDGGENCFLELRTAQEPAEPVLIERLVVGGEFINSVFLMAGTAQTSSPRLTAVTRSERISLVQGPAGGAKVIGLDGSYTGSLVLVPAASDAAALRLRVSPDGGAPLLAVEDVASESTRSGIAAGGALLEAFASASSSGGEVRVDAAACNYFSCRISGDVALAIDNPPATTSQRLTVELVAEGGTRSVAWPGDCRFADGTAPRTVRSGTRTSVTLLRDPRTSAWVEASRSTGVPV